MDGAKHQDLEPRWAWWALVAIAVTSLLTVLATLNDIF